MRLIRRCQIPECEIVSSTDFNPYWLENAVPFEDSKPVRCMRYSPILNSKVYPELNSCEAYAFNRSAVVECLDGEFIFRTDEISIVNEVSRPEEREGGHWYENEFYCCCHVVQHHV